MSNLKKDGKQRWAASYLRRQGTVTPKQKRAIREHWSSFGLEFRYGEIIDLPAHFPDKAPLILEIGFGMGEHLLDLATRNPNAGILGIEVHKPGIGAVLAKLAESEFPNVRVLRGDARLVLSDYLEGRIFDSVHIQFPDPWPDSGDAHRRLVQEELVDLLEIRVKPGGALHFVTDVREYAEHVDSIFEDRENWKSERSTTPRIVTRYEQKGIDSKRSIHERIFRLDPDCSSPQPDRNQP